MNQLICNDNIKSYKYPIFKIIISIIFIVILINRSIFFCINNVILKTVVAIACAALVVICILSIYISFNEIILLYEKRHEESIDMREILIRAKKFSVEYIIKLLKSNDIIEIKVMCNNELIRIGASSDCHVDSFEFFDKSYYINDKEFKTVEEIQVYIIENIDSQNILVISVE